MSEVSKSGRTVLFVSHNMQAVSKLCTKGIYLNNGRLVSSGNIEDVLEDYVKSGATNTLQKSKFYRFPWIRQYPKSRGSKIQSMNLLEKLMSVKRGK
ncbi:MAG: hypothetical protein IPG07_03280 [Crocinitomicaceae bacterium]|nr:hypothetical protein [Crocinitomicaceae bacterium]